MEERRIKILLETSIMKSEPHIIHDICTLMMVIFLIETRCTLTQGNGEVRQMFKAQTF